MCYYTVLVFIFLAYFTLYNALQFHPSQDCLNLTAILGDGSTVMFPLSLLVF